MTALARGTVPWRNIHAQNRAIRALHHRLRAYRPPPKISDTRLNGRQPRLAVSRHTQRVRVRQGDLNPNAGATCGIVVWTDLGNE